MLNFYRYRELSLLHLKKNIEHQNDWKLLAIVFNEGPCGYKHYAGVVIAAEITNPDFFFLKRTHCVPVKQIPCLCA